MNAIGRGSSYLLVLFIEKVPNEVLIKFRYFRGERKSFLLAMMAILVAAGLAGCGRGNSASGQQTENANGQTDQLAQAQTEDAEKDSVIVVMGPSSEPEAGFDPVYGWGAGEHVHEPLIQSTLTVTNKDLTIGYDLATDMETSEDGMTWTVTIRSDVKFTDGEALTAEDVAFTYNTLRDNSTVNDFTMLDEAEATDDTTVGLAATFMTR